VRSARSIVLDTILHSENGGTAALFLFCLHRRVDYYTGAVPN